MDINIFVRFLIIIPVAQTITGTTLAFFNFQDLFTSFLKSWYLFIFLISLSLVLASWLGWLAWDPRVPSSSPVAAELTPGGVDSACHPSEVGEMGTSALLEGHSSDPRNDSFLAAKADIRKNRELDFCVVQSKNHWYQHHN